MQSLQQIEEAIKSAPPCFACNAPCGSAHNVECPVAVLEHLTDRIWERQRLTPEQEAQMVEVQGELRAMAAKYGSTLIVPVGDEHRHPYFNRATAEDATIMFEDVRNENWSFPFAQERWNTYSDGARLDQIMMPVVMLGRPEREAPVMSVQTLKSRTHPVSPAETMRGNRPKRRKHKGGRR